MIATVTGVKEIDRALSRLSDKHAKRLATYCLTAGARVIRNSIKKESPIGETRALKNSIGSRVSKGKGGVVVAKAGINVGKKTRRSGKYAPHGHLVALGTVARTRKTIGGRFAYLSRPTVQQLSTGTMPANDFVKRGYSSGISKARAAMVKAAEKKLKQITSKGVK